MGVEHIISITYVQTPFKGHTMLMSTREKEIIELLIKYYGQYVTIYEIAQQLGVSSRTIHRELKGIETYLQGFNMTLERANKKGLSYLVMMTRSNY